MQHAYYYLFIFLMMKQLPSAILLYSIEYYEICV